MEWVWIILGIILCIVGIAGSLLPLLPGPPIAYAGLLIQQLRDPNPFTTKANIQFTAAESGRAVVELYNIAGIKIRTLFSANVVEGEVYNTSFGDAFLPGGVYVYKISNGKQKHTGKLIKVE